MPYPKQYTQAERLRMRNPRKKKGKSKYGNAMYGNSTHDGIHVTHWKPGRSYAGSMTGSGSIGGGSAGGG